MKMCRGKKSKQFIKILLTGIVVGTILATCFSNKVLAQDGVDGIKQANDAVRKYFVEGVKLMYGIGGVVGLIGAIKVYQKWNSGDQDTSKVAASWFGSCIFLIIVTTVIKSFFAI